MKRRMTVSRRRQWTKFKEKEDEYKEERLRQIFAFFLDANLTFF